VEIALPLLSGAPLREVLLHFAPIFLLHSATLALYAAWRLGSSFLALLPSIALHSFFNVAIGKGDLILLALGVTLSGATLVFGYLAYLRGLRYTGDEIR